MVPPDPIRHETPTSSSSRSESREEELRHLEQRFQATFEQAAVGMAHLAPDGGYLRVNHRLCDILGYDRQELLDLRFQDVTHPDDLAEDLAQARRLTDGEIDSYTLEKRYVRKDGSVVWIQLTASAVRDPTGDVQYFIAVIQDISHRKEIEFSLDSEREALEFERRRLRTVLNVLPAGIWIADAEGRIVQTNEGAKRIWGGHAPRTAAPGRYHEEYRAFWPDGRPVEAGEWGLSRAVERGERSGPEEMRIEGFDGVRRTILNYGLPIFGAHGEIDGAVALCVDITDRKRAETQLRELNARLFLLFRAAGGLLSTERPSEYLSVLFEALSERVGVDLYLNHVVEKEESGGRLRLDSAAGLPHSLVDQFQVVEFGVDIFGRVAETRERILVEEGSGISDTEKDLLATLGASAVVCYPLVAGSDLVGTLAFAVARSEGLNPWALDLLQAISELVATAVQRSQTREAEREARLAAEEASRARTDFLATMSHELRTPLNAIIGYAELLEIGIPAPVEEPQLKLVNRISLSARHLRELIEEVLMFSRLESGGERIEIDSVRPGEILEEIRAIMEPLTSEKGLEFTVEDVSGGETIETDPRKLRQILINLLGNAAKFTDEGTVGLEAAVDQEHFIFTVSDTGIGIPEPEREKVFEPFWQGRRRNTPTAGTGLGLTISRRYAELLGGTLTMESGVGAGTVFELRIPKRRPTDEQ